MFLKKIVKYRFYLLEIWSDGLEILKIVFLKKSVLITGITDNEQMTQNLFQPFGETGDDKLYTAICSSFTSGMGLTWEKITGKSFF